MIVMQTASRGQFYSLIRSPKNRVFQAVVLIGVFCWTSLMTRNVVRMVSGATAVPSNRQSAKKTSLEVIDQNPDDDLEFSDHILTPTEMSADTHGLVLQSTLISSSRRMAVINGEQINEGTTTTIQGIAVQVDLIASQHVMLTIDGTSVRLPLVFGFRQAFGVKTTSAGIDDLSCSSSTKPSTEAPAVFR